MRLGQMARKLGVSQAEIVQYLSRQNLRIEEGSNVKLEEAHVRSLYAYYTPSETFEPAQAIQTSVSLANDGPAEAIAEPLEEHENPSAIELRSVQETIAESVDPTPISPLSSPLPDDPGDIIRAPKIELAGLKVVGKIELPQPRKKETAPSEDAALPAAEGTTSEDGVGSAPADAPKATNAETLDLRIGKDRFQNRDIRRTDDKRRLPNKQPRDNRAYKNPIAAQRERELEEELRRRKEKAEQEKERRTLNYQKRVKHSPPTKPVRLVEEPVEQMSEIGHSEAPTTWFGKFMKWLRS